MFRSATTGRFRLTADPVRFLVASAAAVLAGAPAAYATGMPQLQFGNPLTTGQLFWGAVIFLLLYLILSRSALPRVGQVLAARQTRIEEAARRTAEMNTRLEARIAAAEQEVAAARDAAMRSLRPVAETTARDLVERLTGAAADDAVVAAKVDGVLAARAA